MTTPSMTTRERFQAIMHFKPFDRLPVIEWAAWWDQTINRWRGEGLPELDRYALYDYFGMDVYKQDWLPLYKPGCPQPKSHGAPLVSSMEEYIDFKRYLFPENPIGNNWKTWAKEQQAGSSVLWFTIDGFFWFARSLLGIEQHLYAFYEKPELMHAINNDLCNWMINSIDQLCKICKPDFMTFAEDMSYNLGPMLSKELFDEYMKPYYARVIPRLREYGIIPIIDSDGDITIPASWFEQAGLAGILPLERQANVDINRLRNEHPSMLFIGHYDKMVMSEGREPMRKEFERLLPAAKKGGFLLSVDHQTPPGVSLDNYRIYLELFREYAVKAASQG